MKKIINNELKSREIIAHSMPTVDILEAKSLKRVIKSCFLAEGSEVAEFESELAAYIGSKFAMATSSGTAALHCALLALGIGKGDEVIIPNYVCRSVLNAVQYVGARPVVCDVNQLSFNIDFFEVAKKISAKTKLIIVAHMFGCPADIKEIKKFNIPIIEDCAQSIGAEYAGKKVGSFGDLAIFSFEGTKPITTGEGGMVLTRSSRLYSKLLRLKEPYAKFPSTKYTYRMSSLQAAVGRIQLKKLPGFISKRRMIANKYYKAFNASKFENPYIPPNRLHMFARFILTLKPGNSEKIIRLCAEQGVLVKRPIKPYVINQYLNIPDKLFPQTKFIMENCVSVPIYPSLNKMQVEYVIKVVKSACSIGIKNDPKNK